MNKRLIELQINNNNCVIVLEEEYKKLSPIISMQANVSDKFLFLGSKPPFADKIDQKCASNDKCYFVIKGIDQVSKAEQERFIGLVKDRELNGYFLPRNCIIVFTVQSAKTIKNISGELYTFAIVAI